MTLPSSIRVEFFPRLQALPQRARAMVDDFAFINPFMCTPWLIAFEKHLVQPHESVHYLVATGDDDVLFVLPLLLEKMGTFAVPKLRAMANFYTIIYSPVERDLRGAPDGFFETLMAASAQALSRRFPQVALIEIAPLRGESSIVSGLLKHLETYGFVTRRYTAGVNWYQSVPTGQDFPAYMAQRPGKLRSTWQRKRRALDRETDWRVSIAASRDSLPSALADFKTVYAESWKSDELSPAFIDEVVIALSDSALSMVGVLYIADEPAAAQIWFRIGTAWGVFKLAYRPQFAAYSVGTVLTAAMIESFFSRPETRSLDFLSGDDAYKADWVSERREHWGFEAINTSSFWGRIAQVKRAADRWLAPRTRA